MSGFEKHIRDIPDFPKEGIIFKDITPILQNGPVFRQAIDVFVEQCTGKNIDVVVGIESRGFIFGAALAYALGAAFVPVRKKGKLPYETLSEEYELEYGTDVLEVHLDAVKKGQNVVIIDDLLATGGTCRAVVNLIEQLGANVVHLLFFIELAFLQGRSKLEGYDVFAVLEY